MSPLVLQVKKSDQHRAWKGGNRRGHFTPDPGEAVQPHGGASPGRDSLCPGVLHPGELRKCKNKTFVCFSDKSTLRRTMGETNEGKDID